MENGSNGDGGQDRIYVMADVEDTSEQNRLDLQHRMWVLTFDGKLHTTPLSSGITSILDLGTGTGIWANAVAKKFPNADVVATDLVLPSAKDDAPTNVRYIQHNADDAEWTLFKDGQFDFIHARMITSGIHDWPGLRAKCYKHLKPGGRLEIIDMSHPLRAVESARDSKESSALIKFVHLAGESWRRDGLDYSVTGKQIAGLEKVGFEDINEQSFRWPIGTWPDNEREKKIGLLAKGNVEKFLTLAGKHILTNKDFMDDVGADEAIAAAAQDLSETESRKYYYVMKVHSARKPIH
ncbi:S-adenosyl-L-methionine-dependent methyltransferase [Corynespora cassiicola Philippines]|uniref:S-adenosyl-L-methionine-dependent methyltransferase n=1 Tax=Corynespora cassiicola Philippines TaxID=1448308 RepID=A0A2T2NQI7_CORCC|nr:S-adenosyl-L-methionine-dependent methyltransferase [Corynespora cassiicola Philippines]